MASPADSLSGGGAGGKSRSPGRKSLEALGAGEAGAGEPLPGEPPPRRFTPPGDAAARNDERRASLTRERILIYLGTYTFFKNTMLGH